jgi:hypothetical protein
MRVFFPSYVSPANEAHAIFTLRTGYLVTTIRLAERNLAFWASS